MDIQSKTKEAEVYCSMGLYSEALGVYEKIMGTVPDLDGVQKEKIETAIEEVRKKIAAEKQSSGKAVSGEEITRIRETLSSSGNVQALLDGAFALKELGHYEEAVSEYGRLLQLDFPTAKIVPEIAGCLGRYESPEKAMASVRKLLEGPKFGKKEKARVQFRIGFELEKRGERELACHLYQSAREIDPDDKEIEARLEALAQKKEASVSAGSERSKATMAHSNALAKAREKRREQRMVPKLPDFVYVEFSLGASKENEAEFRLNVVNYANHGLGLIVSEKDFRILKLLGKGDTIENITFYASWALITVDATVRHLTKMEEGPYGGMYIIGLEARDLITSAQPS